MMGRHMILVFFFTHMLHSVKASEGPVENTTVLAVSQTEDNISKQSGNWCNDFDWKGNEIKVMEECDVLKDEIKVKLLRLT